MNFIVSTTTRTTQMKISSQSMRLISMTSLACSATSSSSDGHIWIHSSQKTTSFPSTLASFKQQAAIIKKCRLPKMTPASESKSYNQPTSLSEINKLKAEFYKNQFNQRVSAQDSARIQQRRIKSPYSSHETNVTIYLPKSNSNNNNNQPPKLQGICLHIHGGGWLWGSSYHQVAHRLLEMSCYLNSAVVSVEYSLLHETSFDPVKDTITVIEWMETVASTEFETGNFVASGESSGAHLLLLAMLHRRDAHETLRQKWKGLNLVYGVYDLTGTPSVRNDGDSSSPLCGNELLWLYDLYCSRIQNQPSDSLDRKHPSLSPMYANLSSLPPALISVGTADPLIDDSLMLAERYASHGNEVEVALYEGGEHGIGHFGLQENEVMGDEARMCTLDFMKRQLVGC